MKNRISISAIPVILMLTAASLIRAQSEDALMNKGQELMQRGAFGQAVTAFRQVLAREPDFFEAQFNLGFAYLQWGKNAEAVAELKKALKMQPKSSEAWSNLAIAYDNLKRPNDAQEALAQAVNCNPENVTARMNLAAMYSNARKYQQAIAQFRQVIKIDGTNAEACLNLAKCLITTGEIAEAKQYLKQAITIDPSKSEPHTELGDLYWKKEKDLDKGIAEYRLALSVEPSNPGNYESLAAALEAKGQTAEAIEVLKKSLVYIDDVLHKDKVRDRIDRLEKGGSPSAASSSGGESGPAISREKTQDMERELRQGSPSQSRRLDAGPVDVSGDMRDLDSDSSASWDPSKEAKKRAQEKKK